MKRLHIFIFLLLLSLPLCAQNEVQRQLSSLRGITEFGVVVNIEKPKMLDEVHLNITNVRTRMIEKLEELPVTILEDRQLQKSDTYPILYLHVNVMFVAPGIFPYSAQIRFYQPAKLPLQGDLQTMATTWQTGLVGAVSPDLATTISQEAVRLTEVFVSDYASVNDYEY